MVAYQSTSSDTARSQRTGKWGVLLVQFWIPAGVPTAHGCTVRLSRVLGAPGGDGIGGDGLRIAGDEGMIGGVVEDEQGLAARKNAFAEGLYFAARGGMGDEHSIGGCGGEQISCGCVFGGWAVDSAGDGGDDEQATIRKWLAPV